MSTQPPVPFYAGGRRYKDLSQQKKHEALTTECGCYSGPNAPVNPDCAMHGGMSYKDIHIQQDPCTQEMYVEFARHPSTLALDHYRQQQRRAALFRLAAVALLLALFLVAILVLRTLCGA